MKQEFLTITENKKIAKDVYLMKLEGDTSAITASGQFVNIKLDGKFLRRPISICDYDDTTITLVYKVVGVGTEQMSEMTEGQVLDVLVGLGNGYSLDKCGSNPLLIGGGVGVPPLYNLCKKLINSGKQVTVVLGFNTIEEIFLEDDFKALGAEVLVATADGSYGVKGFVTDAMKDVDYTY
ncbi:MAG: dihydroorotate dehydrogenase electron transfer subunit, partial [Clostridia bacterium]|nr:dihydroorotate dehydrogenase electron transfer subunit [Clostridia bacterium]